MCPPLLRFTDPSGQGPSFHIYITHPHCQIQNLSHMRCSLNECQIWGGAFSLPDSYVHRLDTKSGHGWFAKEGRIVCWICWTGRRKRRRRQEGWGWEVG